MAECSVADSGHKFFANYCCALQSHTCYVCSATGAVVEASQNSGYLLCKFLLMYHSWTHSTMHMQGHLPMTLLDLMWPDSSIQVSGKQSQQKADHMTLEGEKRKELIQMVKRQITADCVCCMYSSWCMLWGSPEFNTMVLYHVATVHTSRFCDSWQ